MKNLHDALIAFYLDYFNNYLTLEKIAEHYNLTTAEATAMLSAGRRLHEERLPQKG